MLDDPRLIRIMLAFRERVAQAAYEAGRDLRALGYEVGEDLPWYLTQPRPGETARSANEAPGGRDAAPGTGSR